MGRRYKHVAGAKEAADYVCSRRNLTRARRRVRASVGRGWCGGRPRVRGWEEGREGGQRTGRYSRSSLYQSGRFLYVCAGAGGGGQTRLMISLPGPAGVQDTPWAWKQPGWAGLG